MTRIKAYIFVVLALVLFVFAFSKQLFAQQKGPNDQEDLFEMSLEQLMNVEITLASKKEETLFETPAAAYVVTSEDIRRSGATSIPEALRMVPGLQVSRINSNSWAITSRGFQDQFANKLLVMIDGRSVYSSNYSGVYWDVQDLMLEDIERIEVVRGPGGALWGANAVNGIINIITKEAKDTQGLLLTGGGGNEEQGFGAVRYGGKLRDDTYYRIYSKYFNRDDSLDASGDNLGDGWDIWRGGFRIDQYKDIDRYTLQGGLYNGDVGTTGTDPSLPQTIDRLVTRVSGGNLLGRWTHTFSDSSDMALQMYYDHFKRIKSTLRHTDDTLDLDFQHRFALSKRQEITWGLGYRYNNNLFDSQRFVRRIPKRRQTGIYSGFVQDKITLAQDKLYLTVGSKFERNSYTGFEYQPSARILWTPNEKNTIWGAVSRAVRTPSRRENDLYNDTGIFMGSLPLPNRVVLTGNEDFESEEVVSYELGYRVQPAKDFFLDLTGFYNVFNNLLTHETPTTSFQPTPSPHMLIEGAFGNKMYGELYGVELSANWNVTDSWKLAGGYTFLQMQLHLDSSSASILPFDEVLEDYSPHNQFHLRSYLDLPGNLEFDTAIYYVDSLYGMNVSSYIRCDARLGWHISKDMELSAVAQNLWDSRHSEFTKDIIDDGEIGRSFFVKLTYRF